MNTVTVFGQSNLRTCNSYRRVFKSKKEIHIKGVVDSKKLCEIRRHINAKSVRIDSSTICNNWKELFDTLAVFPNLKDLYLSKISIENISSTFSKLSHLEKIFIEECSISFSENLINELSAIETLKNIFISSNNLKTIIELRFSKLSRLTDLYIVNTNEDSYDIGFPMEVLSLIKLQRLTLENLGIDSIPDDIVQLTDLRWLALPNNKITEVNEQICKLKKLAGVDFTNNKISILIDCFLVMEKIDEFRLSGNDLDEYPTVILDLQDKHPKKRIGLDLGRNNIKNIPERYYKYKRYYTQFYIGNNYISKEEEKRIYENSFNLVGW